MVDLDAFIKNEKIGYAHSFGEKVMIGKDDLKTLEKSKVEGKYCAHINIKGEDEILDYLTPKDLIALRDNKKITCVWTRSKSGKLYWNHSSQYITNEEE